MKLEFITVPRDKCPLDVLADMGDQTSNAAILLSPNAMKKLKETADRDEKLDEAAMFLSWNATDKFPQTSIILVKETCNLRGIEYRAVYINADDIAFRCQRHKEPEVEYILEMER